MHQRTLSLLWAPDRMLDVVISDPNLYDTTKGVYVVWYWEDKGNFVKSRLVRQSRAGIYKIKAPRFSKDRWGNLCIYNLIC